MEKSQPAKHNDADRENPSEKKLDSFEKRTVPVNAHPDQKYIVALLNNDSVLLKELYEKFSGKIKLMVTQNKGTVENAADIFQDALLAIYKNAKKQNFILTCPFDAFVYIICKNKWMTELNKQKIYKTKLYDDRMYDEIGDNSFKLAEECYIHQARQVLLMQKFEQLNESAKRLLSLSWSGKSMEEVAQILKISYGYARKKKSQCIGKLIELVKQSHEYNSAKWQ
jgi:RNA polymerase sigma factor (sigma-70 family)